MTIATNAHVYDAVIVGAGYGGLGAGAQLVRAGLDNFVILERDSQIGGVWRDNTYPGAACDTQSVIYCYTYFPHLNVSKMYADGAELLGYLHAMATAYDLERRVHRGNDVVAATWLEQDRVWRVTTAGGAEYYGRIFVPAWGQLGVPQIPAIPGLETFQGEAFHSARWNHEAPLEGKRVVSIGAAASAVQYVPFVAAEAAHLTVFQRSANYIMPRNQHEFTADERSAFHAEPAKFEELRRDIHEMREAGFQRVRHDTAEQGSGVAEARAHLEAQVSDPELRRKLTPDYEFGCKRILRTDDYYPALTRPNVELVTARISHVTEDAVIDADGVRHDADVIIFGTGFHSQAFQGAMRITGRDGVDLAERWQDAPEAYLGLAVDGFPNMLLVYGPNTNLNHNSIVTMMEVQHEFIVDAVARTRTQPEDVYDVARDVVLAFNEHAQQQLTESAYSSDCSSWYKNAAGRVVNNWYGTVEEYRRLVAAIDLADFGIMAATPTR